DAAEQARVARDKAEDADTQRRNAEASARKAGAAESRATEKAELERRRGYGGGMAVAQGAGGEEQGGRFLAVVEGDRPGKAGDEDFRGFEWFYWKRQFQRGHVTHKGHTDAVHSVAFSADGKRIASGSSDKTVKVWDAQTGQQVLTLKGHTDGVHSVAF